MKRLLLLTSAILLTSCNPVTPKEDIDDELPPAQTVEEAFQRKYPEAGNIVVIVNQSSSTRSHIRGMVKIDGQGGLFLAANIDGGWVIAFDGNGAIPCSLYVEFRFPEEMLKDCADI